MIINGTTVHNPEWGNTEVAHKKIASVHHARDLTTARTYVKRSDSVIIKFTLHYLRYSEVETLFNAIKENMHQLITITDWNDVVWTDVTLLTNPWEITNVYRMFDCPAEDDYQGDIYEMTLEFES